LVKKVKENESQWGEWGTGEWGGERVSANIEGGKTERPVESRPRTTRKTKKNQRGRG